GRSPGSFSALPRRGALHRNAAQLPRFENDGSAAAEARPPRGAFPCESVREPKKPRTPTAFPPHSKPGCSRRALAQASPSKVRPRSLIRLRGQGGAAFARGLVEVVREQRS